MADSMLTVRPDATTFANGWTIGGGAGSLQAATSDDSDSTYALSNDASGLLLETANPSIPTGALIHSVRLRFRAKGATAPLYMQAWLTTSGTGVPSIITWNPVLTTTITTYTLSTVNTGPNGTWTAADLANVKVGFQGVDSTNAIYLYEAYLDVFYNQRPTVTTITPAATVTDTTSPTVTWNYSDPEGDSQERFRVKVFSALQYGAAGFDPETSTATWDSGEVLSSVTGVRVGVALANNTTYRAYVKVADAGSNGRYSAWSYSTFSTAIDPPAQPTLTATYDSATNRVAFTMQGHDNLLSANQADLVTDTTGWAAGANTTIARSTTQAAHGTASLRLTASAGGDVSATSSSVYSDVSTVSAGTTFSAVAEFRAATTGRQCRIDIGFADSGGTFISAATGAQVPSNSSGWTQAVAVGTVPTGAARAYVVVYCLSAGAGEQHYVDKIGLRPGYVNLLSLDDASFEASLGSWIGDANCNVSRVASVFNSPIGAALQGLYGLQLQAAGAGQMVARATTLVRVVAGQAHTALAYLLAASTSRTTYVSIAWYDAANSLISISTSSGVSDSSSTWTKVYATFTAPAGAVGASCRIVIDGAAAFGELHYVDTVAIIPGTTADYVHPPAWTPGGIVGSQSVFVERFTAGYDDWQPVRVTLGMGTPFYQPPADSVTLVAPLQAHTIAHDYEAPVSETVLYRARVAYVTSGLSVSSGPSPFVAVTVRPADVWLKDPLDPTLNMIINLQLPVRTRKRERQQQFEPLGRTRPVVLRDAVLGEEGELVVYSLGNTQRDAIEALRANQRTLLVQTPLGDNWYVSLGEARETEVKANGTTSTIKRFVTLPFVEVDNPGTTTPVVFVPDTTGGGSTGGGTGGGGSGGGGSYLTSPAANGAVLQAYDDFTGGANSALDATKWNQQVGAPTNSGRLEYCTSGVHNAWVDGNSNAVIQFRRESYGGRNYTVARFESVRTQTSGYIEMYGQFGTWPGWSHTFWAYASPWGSSTQYAEIDYECASMSDGHKERITVHGGLVGNTSGYNSWQFGWTSDEQDFTPNYPGSAKRRWGFYFDSTLVQFWIDGVKVKEYTKAAALAYPWTGGGTVQWGYGTYALQVVLESEAIDYAYSPNGQPDNSTNSDQMTVDYVAWWDIVPY